MVIAVTRAAEKVGRKWGHLGSVMEEGGGSRRLEVMQRVERTIDEELDYMEEIFEARDEVLEERRLLGAGHIEEDEDYLYNLERARLQAEQERSRGTLREPSLVVCWLIVIIVTLYVIFLSIAGDRDNNLVKDEL